MKMLEWLIGLYLLHSVDAGCGKYSRCSAPLSMVNRGSPSCPEKAPWNIIIAEKERVEELAIVPLCGGSLITSRHALSAAHCFWLNDHGSCPDDCEPGSCPRGCMRKTASSVVVYPGAASVYDNDYYVGVSDIFIHPDYDKVSPNSDGIIKGGDLAMLVFKENVLFSPKIMPVCLPDPIEHHNLIGEGQKLNLFGFGLNIKNRVENLQEGNVIVDKHSVCQDHWSLSTRQICTKAGIGPHGATCANIGDSGGGFVSYTNNGTTAVLVGVMSFGSFGRNDCTRPAVATNLYLYLPWINKLLDPGYQELKAENKELKKELKELRAGLEHLTTGQSQLQLGINTVKSGLEKKSADNKREIDATKSQLQLGINTIKMRGRKSSICGWRKVWRNAGTITYGTVHTEVDEVNSVMHANTGIYTAGVSGVYEISLSVLSGVSSGGRAEVWLEGAGYGTEDEHFIYSYNTSNGGRFTDTAAATRHVTLTAGQQISLKYVEIGAVDLWRIKFCVTLY